ncbi:MAG: histidine kinase dimerization/phosphoacceptor domain -containing protein, partial [Flavobacteriaceae bacterium]
YLATRQLEEQYQNDKKEAVIKSKNQQIVLISSFLIAIILGLIILIRKNRQINRQNNIINTQVIDLSKILEQKQMLLSELQHRVKNNLQHVISILEIQKESANFNTIEELIRGNQNRIHSMALLHKKLNISDGVNDVDLKHYITELAELVKESYDNRKKQISLSIRCEVETISIEKALPLGLIIVELVSNSMKHAFKKRNIGIITIEIIPTREGSCLYYSDNGEGFDFDKPAEKGLGQEIIKGLIDQLDGKAEADSSKGFELVIYFK